jgi:hypothetical protein
MFLSNGDPGKHDFRWSNKLFYLLNAREINVHNVSDFIHGAIIIMPSGFISAGFTYKLGRLKHRAPHFRGPPDNAYIIFDTVIGLSHLCCHSVLYFLSNPSVIFLAELHTISEYCRILITSHHLHFYWNWLNTIPFSAGREDEEFGGASQVQ